MGNPPGEEKQCRSLGDIFGTERSCAPEFSYMIKSHNHHNHTPKQIDGGNSWSYVGKVHNYYRRFRIRELWLIKLDNSTEKRYQRPKIIFVKH